MENQRLLFYFALVLLGFAIYQQWQIDYVWPKSAPTEQAATEQATPASTEDQPPAVASNASVGTELEGQSADARAQTVQIQTDVFQIELSTAGANLTSLHLRDYSTSLGSDELVQMLSTEGALYQVPQLGLNSPNADAPTHHALYAIDQSEYRLAEGEQTLVVPLRWTNDAGIEVTKQYTFTRGSYKIAVDYFVSNGSDQPWSAAAYGQLVRNDYAGVDKAAFINAYLGGVVSTQAEPYQKLYFSDMANEPSVDVRATGGWLAMIQHYFAAAYIPDPEQSNKFYSSGSEAQSRYRLGVIGPVKQVAAGEQVEFSSALYIGPKLQEQMEQAASNLRLTVDYGFLTFLSQPIFWLMSKIYALIGNWGWTIILLTLIIKTAFYPLSAAGYKSMAKMKNLAPKMQKLRESYGDDRQKMGQATMELYKKEKVNPVGGCLPMLVQIPVFLALYWVLLESVEMRQAPWILWIEDLAAKDPYFVLPLIMGVTMFIQQKLNPAPVDPIQAKVFTFMPLMFTIFFMFFPAGLVLYWVVNNVLTIAQQYYIQNYVVGKASS